MRTTAAAGTTAAEVWWQDGQGPKALDRIGQQGTLTRLWAELAETRNVCGWGSRPPAPRDRRYTWAYLFGAICPARGVGAGLVLPYAHAEAMSLHLAEISRSVAPGAHAVVVLDGAGWHATGGRLLVPENISLLHLPPYAPELNPQENVRACLRANKLANRVHGTYDDVHRGRWTDIVDACCDAWTWLIGQPERIRSIATRTWAQVKA